MDLITYADGKHDLIDIANIVGVSAIKLIPIVYKLLEADLIEECD